MARFYINTGFVAQPTIISTEYGDLYLYLSPTEPLLDTLIQQYSSTQTLESDIRVQGKEVPLIWVLWFGVILMAVGSSVTIFSAINSYKTNNKNRG